MYKCSKTTLRNHPFSSDVKIDFVRLIGISVVEDSKDVFARTVYCFAQEEVGEEEIV